MSVLDVKIEELDEIVKRNEYVFVDVWASWCMPCMVMSPIFEEISDKYEKFRFIRIESDKDNVVGAKMSVKSIPTFVLYKNGAIVCRKSGMMTEEELEELLLNVG